MRGFSIFAGLCCVVMIGFAIWIPAIHESKAEKIERLEQQVGDLQRRVSLLESK